MPIFEYRCLQCEAVQEFFLRNQEAKEPGVCPLCQGKLVRLVSASSFALKGGGWYATDYTQKCGATASTNSSGACEASS